MQTPACSRTTASCGGRQRITSHHAVTCDNIQHRGEEGRQRAAPAAAILAPGCGRTGTSQCNIAAACTAGYVFTPCFLRDGNTKKACLSCILPHTTRGAACNTLQSAGLTRPGLKFCRFGKVVRALRSAMYQKQRSVVSVSMPAVHHSDKPSAPWPV